MKRIVLMTALLTMPAGVSAQQVGTVSQAEVVAAARTMAERGSAEAQLYVGLAYSLGKGVPQDYTEAAKWLRLAADQGRVEAQSSLADKYRIGEGVPQDYTEAANWWRKAADQGDTAAQFNLGREYAIGEGVPQDYLLAHMWSNLAAAASSGEDKKDAEKLRELIAAKMTPAQIAEAQKLAREWKPKPSK